MTLPILEAPKFETKIPSTNKPIEFRPYLVKEEKILMMALETGDEKQMIKAMKDVIKTCTFDKVNPDDLTMFDLEFLFLKLRSKSVGEITSVEFKCDDTKCNGFTKVEINLDEIEVTFPSGKDTTKKIELTDVIGVTMKPITVRSVSRIDTEEKDKGKLITDLLIASLESVYDAKAVYPVKDIPKAEVTAFIDSLNRSQLKKIEDYIRSSPRLEKVINFKCTKCSKDCSHTLTGIQSFFA